MRNEARARRARHLAFAASASLVVGLDQLSKHLAVNGLSDGPIELFGSVRLALTFNSGASFNFGSDHTAVLSVLALLISVAIAVLGLRAPRSDVAVAYGVLLGGALGNLVDRILREGDGALGGRVVDFVDLGFWPVFNLADSALWVGIGLLLLTSARSSQDPEPGGARSAA